MGWAAHWWRPSLTFPEIAAIPVATSAASVPLTRMRANALVPPLATDRLGDVVSVRVRAGAEAGGGERAAGGR